MSDYFSLFSADNLFCKPFVPLIKNKTNRPTGYCLIKFYYTSGGTLLDNDTPWEIPIRIRHFKFPFLRNYIVTVSGALWSWAIGLPMCVQKYVLRGS